MPTVLPAVPSSSGRRLKKLKKRVKKKSKKEDKKNLDTDTTNSTSPELTNDTKEKIIADPKTIRWIGKLDDPEQEARRIEIYKEERRKRYETLGI
ncbi:unnamed protein product [Oikopleura dioica]|uniref:Uncharacterized protein n=1 Tax=Oikopleura dioica TaxID=34765 RepID=E4XB47_OIKDI|nr:unnamed protein product [Oikopleura dioica]